MIPLDQRSRAGLQFLGSLQHYSSSHIRDLARSQFLATERGRALMEAETDPEPTTQLKRASEAREAALACPAFQHERLYQRYVAEENFVRAIPAVEQKRDQCLEILNRPIEYQGGSLELDDSVPIPDYYQGVEWHLEPGGWDGYDLATPMFMAGVAPYVFSRGGYAAVEVDQNIRQQRVDVVSRLPKDSYARIYEPGCGGLGALAACHQVYPQAELVGSDISTALLKGGHRAARSMGIPIHLKQRDVRDTREPDASFDAVLMYALLHEMPASVAIDAIREAWRILKPGGDIVINDPPPFCRVDAFQAAILDWDTEYRGEPFFSEACSMDWSTVLRDNGFEVIEARALDSKGYPWVNVATKPA
ncbi:class I SAM-dependent methyltransferase [Candidatus Foliamicus sp.]